MNDDMIIKQIQETFETALVYEARGFDWRVMGWADDWALEQAMLIFDGACFTDIVKSAFRSGSWESHKQYIIADSDDRMLFEVEDTNPSSKWHKCIRTRFCGTPQGVSK